jgi:hypothetical protein
LVFDGKHGISLAGATPPGQPQSKACDRQNPHTLA